MAPKPRQWWRCRHRLRADNATVADWGRGILPSFFFLSILNTIQCVFFRGISGLWTRIFHNISSDGQMENIGYSSMLMDFTISITAGLVEPPKNCLTEGTAVRPESRQVNFTIAQVGEMLRIFWLRYAKRWARLHGKRINDRPAHEV